MADLSAEMYHAVDSDDYLLLQQLLVQGADVNQYFDDLSHVNSKTILHFACAKGRTECIRLLLENGALINAADKFRMTSLMYAICANNLDIVKLLLEANSSTIDIQDSSGRTALHFAVEYGSEVITEMLLQNGGNPNIQNHQGFTPLMALMWLKNIENYIQIMKILVSHGTDVNVKSHRDNRNALHLAVITKKVAAVQFLLEQNVDLNIIDGTGRTPLTHIFTQHLQKWEALEPPSDVTAMVVLMTEAGAAMNISDTESCNPLMMAVKSQCHQFVRYFLENEADVDIKVPFSEIFPLMLAVKNEDLKTISTLLEWKCRLETVCFCRLQDQDIKIDAFELAAYKESMDIVNILCNHGYNVSKWLCYCDKENSTIASLMKPHVLDSLRKCADLPRHLTDICILTIFCHLRSNICHKLDLLPLPKRIGNYIKCNFFIK